MNNKVDTFSSILQQLDSETDSYSKKKNEVKYLIASRLDDFRVKLGFKSKRELAAYFKKRPSEIQKWFSGKHNFTIETLVEISEKLSIDLLDLLKEDAQSCTTESNRQQRKSSQFLVLTGSNKQKSPYLNPIMHPVSGEVHYRLSGKAGQNLKLKFENYKN